MQHAPRRRMLAVLTAAFLLAQFCLLSIPVGAEEVDDLLDADMFVSSGMYGNTVSNESATFMGELFFGPGYETFRVAEGRLSLPFGTGAQEVQYSTAVTPTVYDTPNNAIRLVFSNVSSATYIHVKYTYVTETGPKTETQRIETDTYSTRCTYILRTPYADQLVNLSLVLPGASGGTLILYGLESIRVWTSDTEENGTILSCTYDAASKTVTVKGSVYHDVMIRATGGTLGLFRLSPEQTVEDLVNDTTIAPLAQSAISIGFQLQTAAGDVSSRFARYAVLICMPDGTRLPIAASQYALAATGEQESSAVSRGDFKGIDTTLIASAIDSNVGSAIVDVYLNRLENDRHSGYLYTVENQYFYFDRAYLAELDACIRSLSGAACRVYLRFLTEDDGGAMPFAVSTPAGAAQTSTTAYRALRADDEESLRYLYAYTSFLCSRYNDTEKGDIAGIIVGARVDDAAMYNDAGEMTLAEYTALYGQAFSVIAATARDVCGDITMVVPVSDAWNAELIGQTHRTGSYTTELFAESLANYLTTHGGSDFSLMIESTHNPYGLDNAYFEPVNTDGQDISEEKLRHALVAAGSSAPYVSSENIELLDAYLTRYTASYEKLSNRYLFHWTPDDETSGNALSASYVYHYYRLFHDSRAHVFFVSFRHKEESGNTVEFSKIKYLVKYIDTSGGSDRTSFALDIFGVDSWANLISGFYQGYVERMALIESTFDPSADEEMKGSYALFDFSAANSTRGWYAGNYCRSLSLVSSEQYGKTLDAVMAADHSTLAEYSDIAYEFEHPEMLFHAPYLTMTLAVDCATDPSAVFEVKLTLGSDAGYTEAKQVVKNGEVVTLTLNTSHFGSISQPEYMRLSVKTVMGEDETFTLHLKEMTLNSSEHDSETLRELASAIQRVARGEGMFLVTDTDNTRSLMLLFVLIGTVLCTMIVILMLGHYQKHNPDGDDREGS